MRKYMLVLVAMFMVALPGCTSENDIICGEGTVKIDGQCEVDTVVCSDGFYKEDGECVPEEVTSCQTGYIEVNGECVEDNGTSCQDGYHEVGGTCVLDEVTCGSGYHEEDGVCVINPPVETPEWFDGWKLLNEPTGDRSLDDYTFTETGFSVFLNVNDRTGIQMTNLTLEPGFYYEVKFDYSSDVAGHGIFVQLQGHSGYHFTNPGVMTSESVNTFSQILPFPPTAPLTNDGWFTIEITPSGSVGEVRIDNVELIKTALPDCGVNEELSGIECIPANNGNLPNGTPTAWFSDWAIMSVPAGNKEVSDYDFTETGFTTYLSVGDRTGIEFMGYEFESGYTYEFSFDYTASSAGRLIWVQMEALGGYGFTDTDTWSIDGTGTFSRTLTIPSTYTPTETGWIKIELAPGAMDNITIDNIVITKTPN